MAKLEFYRQQVVPRISTPSARGLAAVGTQAAETAEAVARGAQAFGQLAADLDQLRVEDAYNKLRDRQTDLMVNPETGFTSKRAGDAVDPMFIQRYSGDFDKAIDEIANALPNNRQQDLFRRRAGMAKAEYSDSLMRHVLRETDQYRDNVYKGAVATETNQAALNWRDPAKIADSIGRIAANTALWADRAGITGDALLATQMDNLANLHSTVVNAALDAGDVEYAAKYLDANKASIRADRLVDLEGKVAAETDLRASARIADDVIAKFKGRIPSETEVRQAVREIAGDNVKVRDDATQEALAQVGSMLRDRERQQQEVMAAVYGRLEANGGNLAALPASLRAAIPGDKIGAVRNYANGLRGGGKVETDMEVYYKLRINPSLLKETNLLSLRNVLEDTEFKELARLQADLTNAPEVAQTEIQTTTQRMNTRFAEMGITPDPRPGTDMAKRVAKAWSILGTNIADAERAAGRKLTPEQRNAEIDRLFASVEVRSGLFGTDEVALFEVKPGQDIVTVAVPDFDRRQITNALRAAGKPVTEQNIQYYFQKAQGLVK
jgi:hypothetical protein